MKNVKYSEIINYVLILLYNAKKQHPKGYFSLHSILTQMGYSSAFSDAAEMAEYFETKGVVKVVNVVGDVLVQITPLGKIEVEELEQKVLDKFQDIWMKNIQKTDQLPSFGIFYPAKKPKEKLLKLISNIYKEITKEHGEHSDFVNDVKIIELEIKKNDPDYRIVEIKLDQLSILNFIVSPLSELKSFITHVNI